MTPNDFDPRQEYFYLVLVIFFLLLAIASSPRVGF